MRTRFIAGFAGETERDFEETLAMVEQVGFDSAFMFAYSPREGTPAFGETETLTAEAKQERLERLIALQMRITEKKLDAMAGRVEEILIEDRSSKDAAEWAGKTSCFKKVVLPDAPVKVFLTARDDVRAARRQKDETAAARAVAVEQVRDALNDRDAADATLGRATRPEDAAADAVVLDTSDMTAQEVIDAIVARAEECT